MEVEIDWRKVGILSKILGKIGLPDEEESGDHAEQYSFRSDELANAYFAIVAICHQTSPIGERRLRGSVSGEEKVGWNYLKEAFLSRAEKNTKLTDPDFWMKISPKIISSIYEDEYYGKTLSRVNERAYLIRNCGEYMNSNEYSSVHDVLEKSNNRATGKNGFLETISVMEAYRDPTYKKGIFFLSIVSEECGWNIRDKKKIPSPVDYHELRGHIRIGTVRLKKRENRKRLKLGLPVSEEEDTELRKAVQKVISKIASDTGNSPSKLHYLFWNVFRECCPRESKMTHCSGCSNCSLPNRYKNLDIYDDQCMFSEICDSSGEERKFKEPAYIGHFY